MAMVQHWVYTLGDDGKLSLKKASDSATGRHISEDTTTFEVRGSDQLVPDRKPVVRIVDQVKAFFVQIARWSESTLHTRSHGTNG